MYIMLQVYGEIRCVLVRFLLHRVTDHYGLRGCASATYPVSKDEIELPTRQDEDDTSSYIM